MTANPALLDAQAPLVISRLNALWAWVTCHAIGGLVTDGGTTQAAGANGALNFDIDTTAVVEALVDGVVHVEGAHTDADADAGATVLWGATSGVSVIFAVVLETGTGNGTPDVVGVPGTVATTGSEVTPTDDEIDAVLGHDNWVRLSDVTIARTATTTVTFSANDAARYPEAIRNGHRLALAESEAEFRETSPTLP